MRWCYRTTPLFIVQILFTFSTVLVSTERVPLTILNYFDDSFDSISESYQDLIKDSLLPAVTQWAQDNIKVDPITDNILRIDRKCTNDMVLPSSGGRKCIQGCSAEQFCGSHQIPSQHLAQCVKMRGTSPDDAGDGVTENFILYVSVGDCSVEGNTANTAVAGAYCQIDKNEDGRPVHGYMKFCESELHPSLERYEELVHKTLQRLLNILAFDRTLFARFHDSTGARYTATISKQLRDFDTAAGPQQTYLDYIVLPTVKEEVQSHFSCQEAPGAQLESDLSSGEEDVVYLEKLFFGNELMAASIEGRGVVSRITRAVLVDSGWYDVSEFAEPLAWGRDGGCGFLNKFCYEQLSSNNYSPADVSPFCVTPDHTQCTSDHRGHGTCNIGQTPGTVPNKYVNFPSNFDMSDYSDYSAGYTTVGLNKFADRCPYYEQDTMCSTISNQPSLNYYGQEYAGMSRCFNFEGPWISVVSGIDKGTSGCYPVECGTDSYKVRVNKHQYTCATGATVDVGIYKYNIWFNGTLACPDYNVMCGAHLECSKDCHGNGKCVPGDPSDQCICYPGYHGEDCSLSYGVNYCLRTPCEGNQPCVELDGTFRCDCSNGMTGVFCHLSTVCTGSSCHNGGRCDEEDGEITCHCVPGYSGDRCQNSLVECEENECTNEAQCYVDETDDRGFSCACPYNYEGPYCDSVKECAIFGPLACANGGVCYLDPEGSNYCQCPDGFLGNFCEAEICLDNTCNGNGGCYADFLSGTVMCTCNEFYMGERCDIEATGPPIGTQCLVLNKCSAVNGSIVCNEGYTGTDCMSVDYCLSNTCSEINTAKCNNIGDSYDCECLPGWVGLDCTIDGDFHWSTATTTSAPLTLPPADLCDPDPCFNGAECVSNSKAYFCRCTEGYSGKNCETSRGQCYRGPCKNGGMCSEESGSEEFACSCVGAWTGPSCEEDLCTVQDCQNGAECVVQQDGVASCECNIGYSGERCEIQESHCFAEPCMNDGECQYHADNHTFTCACLLGFTGATCSEEVENSCSLSNTCQNEAPCVGSLTDYVCNCTYGLEGDYCETNPNDCIGNPCQNILFSHCRDQIGGYDCACMSGFEKKKDGQCGDENECSESPCENGVCINLPGKYRCICRPGWKGTNCDINYDECGDNAHKCKNGATCVDLIADYSCECVDGFKGTYCETAPEPCDAAPCLQDSPCRNINETDFQCSCPTGFVGKRCETNYDECQDEPCGEHGTCIDGINLATCDCDLGWGGASCNIYTGHCLYSKSPCMNGATCVDLPVHYECQCTEHFTGEFCQENIDDCAPAPCLNGGTCSDGLGTFTCTCTDQWTGDTCSEDVDECQLTSNPCSNNSTCLNTQGGFGCDCRDGFEGELCSVNTDDCLHHQCGNGGTCVDDIAGYSCHCPEDYKGSRCEIEVQRCEPASCLHNGTCSVVANVVQCDCVDTGFEGARCEHEINECANITCLHGGECVDQISDYRCDCPCSFTGPICEQEVDFCFPNSCSQHTSFCLSLPNSCTFRCECLDGYQGDLCQTETDECAASPCIHGNCTDLVNGYTCSCLEGYGGVNCDEILDQCHDDPCKNGAACETVVLGGEREFRCTCTALYHGRTCEEKRPPCTVSPCGDHGICQPRGEAELCICDEGFTGARCQTNIDDCVEAPCRNDGVCQDKISDFDCDCQAGYGGKTCEALRDPCTTPDICLNGGSCSECEGDMCQERYTCSCPTGFNGSRCQEDIDDCLTEPCVYGICIDAVNDFNCYCNLGYEGKQCDVDTDECAVLPCLHGNECVDMLGNYTCKCVGFTGVNCETDIDECSQQEGLCQNGGECHNVLGTYECHCAAGFGGDNCERVVEPCDAEPCQNLGECENLDTVSYRCNCVGGYTGDLCEVPSALCEEYSCNNGTCVEEEGATSCVCHPGFMGEVCEVVLCRPGLCSKEGVCSNTLQGFHCTCPLPYVGETCQDTVSVIQFTAASRAVVPLGEVTEAGVKLRLGLKVTDMITEQEILSQSTNLGTLTLRVVNSAVEVILADMELRLPLLQEYTAVSVTLVEHYLELNVGNETEVYLFLDPQDVTPNTNLQLGAAVTSSKRAAVSSYTGCLVDLDNSLRILDAAVGEGFTECQDSVPSVEVEACANSGVRIGPFCQCPAGFRGGLCEESTDMNCQAVECPGSCRETSQGPECVCSWPNEGELCNYLTIIPSFRADSSLTFEEEEFKKLALPEYEIVYEIYSEYPRGFIVVMEGSNGFCSMYLDYDHIFFDCRIAGEYHSREHPSPVSIDTWTLVLVTIVGDMMSITVNGEKELFIMPFTDVTLDGSIVFGSIPGGFADVDLDSRSLPGFFGEIHPVKLLATNPDLLYSQGYNMVSAKSRDMSEPYASVCSFEPCGENGVCYDLAEGFYCDCDMNSGEDCSEAPKQLTFYGGRQSHAVFNARYTKTNEFQIRFKSDSLNGVLLYGASKYKGTVPSSMFYVALVNGILTAGVYQEPSSFHSIDIPVNAVPEEWLGVWTTVIFTISPQKMSLQLNEGYSAAIERTRFSTPLDQLFTKSSFYVGGPKDFVGLDDLYNNFDAHLPFTSLYGTVSEVYLNKKLLMGSLANLLGVTTGGTPSRCAVDPCDEGYCTEEEEEEKTCLCENIFREGDLCETAVSFQPLRVDHGCLIYHKSFEVGSEIVIRYISHQPGARQELVHITPMFDSKTRPENGVRVGLENSSIVVGNVSTYLPLDGITELRIKRTVKHIEVYHQDELVVSAAFSSHVKLDKLMHVGCKAFVGQIFQFTVDDMPLEPVKGTRVSQGIYPPCYNNPCLNGGGCMETSATEFTCNCSAGYTSTYCNELVDLCTPFPCNQTSQCFSVSGLDFICQPCPMGYRGVGCEVKAFCELLEPCTFGNITGNCTETEDSFTCECGDGKERRDCDLAKTCTDVQCQHNGTCLELDDGFECQCPASFEGRYCEVATDNCSPGKCLNNGTCISLFDDERGYFCLCDLGYSGDTCELEDNLCTQEPCENGGVCSTIPGEGIFTCDCPDPYSGHICNQAPCDSHNCHEGECYNLNRTHSQCSCLRGWTGELCNLDVDECLDEDACTKQGMCMNSVGNYTCRCYPGFEGRDCEVNIDDCQPDPCSGHGLCMDGYNEHTCLCDPLYQGDNCSEQANKCQPDPCLNNAACYNYGVDYFCICPAGYEGVNCSINTDDCRGHRCEHGAQCEDQVDGYRCQCGAGYSGIYCEMDVDECAGDPCSNGGECRNTEGGFTCICSKYFTGPACELELGECFDEPCQNGGKCYEMGVVGEGRVCQCREGWKGENCTDKITECQTNPCQNGGECRVSEEGYFCECEFPYTGPACKQLVSVPHLSSSSYLIFDAMGVNLISGFNFRFLPKEAGTVFWMNFNGTNGEVAEVIASYSTIHEEFILQVSSETDSAFTNVGILVTNQWQWCDVTIRVSSKTTLVLELNGVESILTWSSPQLKTLLRKPSSMILGQFATSYGAGFTGCFYDVSNVLSVSTMRSGVASSGVTQCQEGSTCTGGSGRCGVAGTCSSVDASCICEMGTTGTYCDRNTTARSPMFHGDGYLKLKLGRLPKSWSMKVTVSGEGGVMLGYDTRGMLAVTLTLDSTSVTLSGAVDESILVKGYYGEWLDVTVTVDAAEQYVFVQLGSGEELATLIRGTGQLGEVYLGGSPDGYRNFEGCFTDLTIKDKSPVFEDVVGVSECTMSSCSSNPCRNTVVPDSQSECVEEGPRHFSCVCRSNYTGQMCDTIWSRQTPRFSSNSYIKFRNPSNSSELDLMFTLVFKVTSRAGLLFTTETTDTAVDYLSVGLIRGRVYLGYDLGAGPALLRCPRRVDDGGWHFVHVTLRGRHAVLMVDRWATEAVSPGERSVLNVGPHFYVGGAPPGKMPTLFKSGITGCVESLAIRDEPFSMYNSEATSNVEFCEDNVPETSIYNFRYRL